MFNILDEDITIQASLSAKTRRSRFAGLNKRPDLFVKAKISGAMKEFGNSVRAAVKEFWKAKAERMLDMVYEGRGQALHGTSNWVPLAPRTIKWKRANYPNHAYDIWQQTGRTKEWLKAVSKSGKAGPTWNVMKPPMSYIDYPNAARQLFTFDSEDVEELSDLINDAMVSVAQRHKPKKKKKG